MKLCDKRGIKVPHYGKNKQFYLDALQGASGDDEGNAEDNDDAESGDEYEGKSAMELYKLCKKRGIEVASKKPAKFYAEALRTMLRTKTGASLTKIPRKKRRKLLPRVARLLPARSPASLLPPRPKRKMTATIGISNPNKSVV